jgi:hypothetical protein
MQEQNGPNDLRAIAHQAMTDRGLEPDFPAEAIQQLTTKLGGPLANLPRDETVSLVTAQQ